MRWFVVWLVGTSACFVTKVPYVFNDMGDAQQQFEASIDASTADTTLHDAVADGDVLADRGDARADVPRDNPLEAGVTYCGGMQVDTRSDSDHCGRCFNRCDRRTFPDSGVAGAECQNGICTVIGCDPPLLPNMTSTGCVPCGTANGPICDADAGPPCRNVGSGRLRREGEWCLPCGGYEQKVCDDVRNCDVGYSPEVFEVHPFLRCMPCGSTGQVACSEGRPPCDSGHITCQYRALLHLVGCTIVARCALRVCPVRDAGC